MLAFGRSVWVTYSAQIAQIVGEVVVAPPWELHAFVIVSLLRSARVWSLGVGDALSAQVVGGVLLWLLRDCERNRVGFVVLFAYSESRDKW